MSMARCACLLLAPSAYMKISNPKSEAGNSSFLSDIKALRDRARQEIGKGAVTPSYKGDLKASIEVLNQALATELVCVLRYKYHYFNAQGIHSESVRAEFLEHANEEQMHADQLAERIVQLGGKPEMNPQHLTDRSHSQYVEGKTLLDMIREDLIAERIAIESYREMVSYFGEQDPTTRRLLESILAKEEEHADDLVNLLRTLHPVIEAGKAVIEAGKGSKKSAA